MKLVNQVKKKIFDIQKDVNVGFFLAVREIKRSNPWSTALIIFVMSLTFLNMVLMGGVLIGLAEGMMGSFKQFYSSNLIVKPSNKYSSIKNTSLLNNLVQSLPTYQYSSTRYTTTAIIENENNIKIKNDEVGEKVGATIVGISPENENIVTNLSSKVILGSYLDTYGFDQILIGKGLISQYNTGSSTEPKLNNIYPDTELVIIVSDTKLKVKVKGIIDTGNTTIDNRVYIHESTLRKLTNNTQLNANEIAIQLDSQANENQAKELILNTYPFPEQVIVETSEESLPKAIFDMKKTFSMLGNLVGIISLVVGAITIFIVIFVNAVTRRKYIGILKGTGISSKAIEISYIFQSMFFATTGILIASFLVLYYLKPWFDIHPLQFPVTQGSLAVTETGLLIRGIILLATSLISGYIPALLITKQNTLDAILGR